MCFSTPQLTMLTKLVKVLHWGQVELNLVIIELMKKFLILFIALIFIGAGCSDADVASYNLSKAADQFEIQRRVVFYNGITGEYMLTVEGRCSLGNFDSYGQLSITCKTDHDQFKKHFLGLSDNVTYFVEQLDGANVSEYHYRVIFKPATIIPDIDLKL